jgi:hypothetical protein
MSTETKFYRIDCDLVKQEQKNYRKFKQEQKTIFEDNKSFSDVITEGIIFALGTATALTILAAIITAAQNLIY